MKKVLITGANSYIGDSISNYLMREPENYSVTIKDTIGWNPETSDFLEYDVVIDVAGIAHVKETKKNRPLYYEINRNLAIRIAKAAKKGGVEQFILLSSMSVYGCTIGKIRKNTPANPINAYGKSKVEADQKIEKLADESFKFVCLRPPMVYGPGCKGNYCSLRKIALYSPIFPRYSNKRSMIFIGNLCEFVKRCISEEKSGIFFPQNSEYVNTSKMVEIISKVNSKKTRMTRVFNWIIKICPGQTMKKVFGNLIYEPVDRIDKYNFVDSIIITENKRKW